MNLQTGRKSQNHPESREDTPVREKFEERGTTKHTYSLTTETHTLSQEQGDSRRENPPQLGAEENNSVAGVVIAV